MKKLFRLKKNAPFVKKIEVRCTANIVRLGFVFMLVTISNNLFSQFYAGNHITNNGVTITPGYLFKDQVTIEAEGTINGVDAFIFGKYSLFVGKQFIVPGKNDNEDNCMKIKLGAGPTLSKIQRTYLEIYDDQSSKIKMTESKTNFAFINMNYRAEIIWHKNTFDYIMLAGYNNGFYAGLGWRGIFNCK